ncbi:glyoxalase/bleomycin resistance protein/dioxygenase [Caballeronia arvi]|uniref:Glyoxalase/bleomycin resistance protein/dioxygenase n=1 Tax=Caballeronia arvi TaxID=1777135 RepID=A0A158KK67_9BURK|nr:VOC family protein [Caballeronia arvi]SAL80791.1 glyoxalase/bleomycin resistance protein/dioxygenase [Caballeronia arvi]
MTNTLRPFHLAFPVYNLDIARKFYGEVLGCHEGRSTDHWIDFNLFGHQIVAHLSDAPRPLNKSDVDVEAVPIPRFGVVLTLNEWSALAEQVQAAAIQFIVKPQVRFRGQAGEQATMFFLDPFGNAIEFKAMSDLTQLFGV